MKAILRDAGKRILTTVFPHHTFSWRVAGNSVALTFDDGPDPEFTPQILGMLANLQLRATFFLIGEKVQAHPALARAIVDGGHSLGGHSYAHKELPLMHEAELIEDLNKTRKIIFDATGVDTPLFRPPRGRFNFSTLKIAANTRHRLIHWSVTYSDYRRDGIEALRKRGQQRTPRAGDIILLHDNNPYTVEFLPFLAASAQKAGLCFGTVPYR